MCTSCTTAPPQFRKICGEKLYLQRESTPGNGLTIPGLTDLDKLMTFNNDIFNAIGLMQCKFCICYIHSLSH